MRAKFSRLGTTAVFCLAIVVLFSGCKFTSGWSVTKKPTLGSLPPITAVAATYPSSTQSWHTTSFSTTTFSYSWSNGGVDWSEIYANGIVSSGSLTYSGSTTSVDDAYDNFGYLHLQAGGRGQPFEYVDSSVSMEDSSLELVLPTQNLMGVDVKRKLYANPTPSFTNSDIFIRWLDILTNNTAAPITVKAIFAGNVGSDSSTQIVGDPDGDLVLQTAIDNWFITGDSSVSGTFGDPILGHIVDGSTAFKKADLVDWTTTSGSLLAYWWTGYSTSPYYTSTITHPGSFYPSSSWSVSSDNFLYNWSGISLQPGETKILMHLELLALDSKVYAPSPGLAGLITSMGTLQSAPAPTVAGMDADEMNAVINFPVAVNNCNVQGMRGSVLPRALVTVNNVTQGTTAQSYSLGTGAFGVCINAVPGDNILATDGRTVYTAIVQ